MKTDPNRSCVCLPEVRTWALIHDLVAHPLMAAFNYAEWTRRFHDYTSNRAWPRIAKHHTRLFLLDQLGVLLRRSPAEYQTLATSERLLSRLGFETLVVTDKQGHQWVLGLRLILVPQDVLALVPSSDPYKAELYAELYGATLAQSATLERAA